MSVNSNMQNLVTFIDLKQGKLTLMLNYGVSCKTAKIEEYSFDKSIENLAEIKPIIVNIIKTFVENNSCDKADCYLVLPSYMFSYEYITLPNLGVLSSVKPKDLLKEEISKIFRNANDLCIESTLAQKNKKSIIYKCCITKKAQLNAFAELFKECNLNLKNISFDASSTINAVMALTKTRQTPFVCLNVKQNVTQVLYCFKGQLLAFYDMPFGTVDIEKQKLVGTFGNNDEAVSEVYFLNEASKSSNSALVDEAELLKMQHETWQDMQQNISALWTEQFTPLVKSVLFINETIAEYDLPSATTIFVNIEKGLAKDFKTIVKNKKSGFDIRFLEDEFATPCGLKDYLHLYGMIFAFKDQKGNNFMDKE